MAVDWRALAWFTVIFCITTYRMVVVQDTLDQVSETASQYNGTAWMLQHSVYGDFDPIQDHWLDLPGFTNNTSFGWAAFATIRNESNKLTAHALGNDFEQRFSGGHSPVSIPLYSNVTSITNGQWKRSLPDLQRPVLNMTEYAPHVDGLPIHTFGRNVSSIEGSIILGLEEIDDAQQAIAQAPSHENNVADARYVKATLEVEDGIGGGDSWTAQMQGVHFRDSGHVLLSTYSEKFSQFALPHLVDHPALFNVTRDLWLKLLNNTAAQSLMKPRMRQEWQFPKCELIVYLQQIPVLSRSIVQLPLQASDLFAHEHELQHPTGRMVPDLPPLQFSLVAFSPDCGYVLMSQGPPLQSPQSYHHLEGAPFEIMQQRARRHVFGYVVVVGLQLWLLMRQLSVSHSPAMLNRISFSTASILVINDGLSTILITGSNVLYPGLFVLLMATIFLAFQRTLFGAQLMMEIWAVQGPELERDARPQGYDSGTTAARRIPTATRSLDSGILPVTVPTEPLTGDFGEPMTETHACFTTGAFPIMIGFVIIAPLVINLPWLMRRSYFCALALFSLSFWAPQIKRSAVRNCRLPLRWEFVVGQTVLRLVPLAYVYGYRGNVFHFETHRVELVICVIWAWLQCLALASQEILGPRWFVRDEWLPAVYDYHPVLHMDEESNNLPIGSSSNAEFDMQSGSELDSSNAGSVMAFDCAICMQSIEALVLTSELVAPPSMLARRSYMLTPCRHIFHTKCLEGWMSFWNRGRLPCPICREELPPM